jgi:hypothetical protein
MLVVFRGRVDVNGSRESRQQTEHESPGRITSKGGYSQCGDLFASGVDAEDGLEGVRSY